MNHGIGVLNQIIYQFGVTNITDFQSHPGVIKSGQVLLIASIGQRIKNRNVPIRSFTVNVAYEVGADKACAAGDNNVHIPLQYIRLSASGASVRGKG